MKIVIITELKNICSLRKGTSACVMIPISMVGFILYHDSSMHLFAFLCIEKVIQRIVH